MFFIYGTDAPIYHYPIVTTVMVIVIPSGSPLTVPPTDTTGAPQVI